MDNDTATKVMLASMQQKSMAVGVLLTFFFGGLGVFYSSIIGGIIMTFVELFCWFTGLFIFIIPLIFVHVAAMVWTVVAINSHNKRVIKQVYSR